MNQEMKSLDLDSNIGDVTLSNGQSLDIPKLSMFKIIKVVKFLGVDGSKLYSEFRETITDESLDDLEKFSIVLDSLDEKQLVRIFSILLDQSDEDVLKFDPNEMLEILLVYVDKLDLKKTYSLIRELMKKMFNKDLPEDLGTWFKEFQEKQRVKRLEVMKMRAQAMAQAQAQAKNGEKS